MDQSAFDVETSHLIISQYMYIYWNDFSLPLTTNWCGGKLETFPEVSVFVKKTGKWRNGPAGWGESMRESEYWLGDELWQANITEGFGSEFFMIFLGFFRGDTREMATFSFFLC